jgi:hypothetical protein
MLRRTATLRRPMIGDGHRRVAPSPHRRAPLLLPPLGQLEGRPGYRRDWARGTAVSQIYTLLLQYCVTQIQAYGHKPKSNTYWAVHGQPRPNL